MTTAPKIKSDGKPDGEFELHEAVFGLEPNAHVMHLAVRRELANGRAGTACALTRSEVRGGGKKPWKQKGTGRARAGSIRSPLWKGGGVIFGPKPRDFSFEMPKNMRRLALRSALSVAVKDAKLHVVEDFGFLKEPKTKLVAAFVDKLNLKDKKILILADTKADENRNLALAARNLPEVKLRLPMNLSVKDLVLADAVIVTAQGIQEIQERLVPHGQ